jgi:uncharacterized protein (TIGR00251 family)
MRILQVKVKLNARSSLLAEQDDGVWLAQIKAPPVDGKANKELIGLVAEHFGVSKSKVSIKSGATSRLKRVSVQL